MLAAASHTLAGHLYSKLAYDPVKDFIGVAYIGNSGYVIAAPGNLGVDNTGRLREAAQVQAGPAQLRLGRQRQRHAPGRWRTSCPRPALEMQHVPMKSTGDAVNEVLAGRVQGVIVGR